MSEERREPEEPDPTLVVLGRYTGHGLTIAVSTGLFLLAGWWVDGRLGTTPLVTIVGALVGAGAGFYSMIQHLLFFPRREREEAEARRRERDDGAGGDVGGVER